MKKILLAFVLFWVPQINAYALQYIDETNTGNYSWHAADFVPREVPIDQNVSLGGGVRNAYVVRSSQQFIVNQYSLANYIAVSGVLSPSLFVLDDYREQYLKELRNQGLGDDEIIEALNDFVGPSQSIDVNFSIIKGSDHFPEPNGNPVPSTNILSAGTYKFVTDNSLYEKEFKNILIPLSPFETLLEPNQDYWLMASDSTFSGTRFSYDAKIVGDVTTPEPATLFLLGGGLAGAIWRRRKVAS